MTTALERAFRRRLPGTEETLFLRACLAGGDEGRLAWSEWLRRRGAAHDVLASEHRYRRLGPLLAAAELPIDDAKLRTALGAAVLREGLRYAELRAAAGDVLRRLDGARMRPIVLNGLVHAELAYPAPAHRHTHDVDVLVPDPAGAAEVLSLAPGTTFRHANGTSFRLWRTAYPPPASPSLRVRTVPLRLDGVVTDALAPADALVAAAVHGFRLGPASLVWAADAYFTTTRASVDWDAVARCHSSVVVPLLVALSWLQSSLAAPVPPGVLERLARRSRIPSPAAVRLAAPAAWRAVRRYAATRRPR